MSEMKESAKRIDNLYSHGVVFERNMALCAWGLGMDVGSGAGESQQAEVAKVPKTNSSVSQSS